jgi:hypothetical protein
MYPDVRGTGIIAKKGTILNRMIIFTTQPRLKSCYSTEEEELFGQLHKTGK